MAGEKTPGTGAYEGDDLLMAAITGEHVPEEAARSAEYREAAADLGLLRLALRDLGEELAAEPATASPTAGAQVPATSPAPAPQTPAESLTPTAHPSTRPFELPPVAPSNHHPPAPAVPVRVRRRRMFAVAVRAVATAGAVALAGGLLWLGAQEGLGGSDAGRAADAPSRSDQGGAGAGRNETAPGEGGKSDEGAAKEVPPSDLARRIACARILVEGTAVDVAARPDGSTDLTLDVTRWYRPDRSVTTAASTTVTLPAPLAAGVERGEQVLVTVYTHPEDGYDLKEGAAVEEARRDLLAALPRAENLTCPAPWKNGAGAR